MQRALPILLILACASPVAAQTHQSPPKDNTKKTAKAPADVHHATPPTDDAHAKSEAATSKEATPATKKSHGKPSTDDSDETKSGAKKSHRSKSAGSDVLADIEHERVDYWVAAFSKMHDYHKKIAAGFVRKAKYQDMLEKKLRKRGMPQNLIYLAFEESAFNPDAGSRAKAVGIWQLTPATARLYGLKVNKKIDERKNVEKETDAALNFLSHLHKRFGCWYLAAAAYDSGENRVARLMRKRYGREHGRDRDYYKIWDDLPGETRDYVPAIVALNRIGKNPSKYGF